jgi:predicted DNA-binding WGR domain protein
MQTTPLPCSLYMRCIDPALNKNRFYSVRVQQTLFGQWAVIREWGRIGSRTGQRLEHWFDDVRSAKAVMDRISAAKRRRGYE